MFAEVKAMLPISGDLYDREIVMQIKAAVLDLTRTSDIVLPGEVDITVEPRFGIDETDGEEEILGWDVTDNSTLTDEYCVTAIATWCQMRIGNPANYANLLAAYESMKGAMRLSHHYTEYDGRAEE